MNKLIALLVLSLIIFQSACNSEEDDPLSSDAFLLEFIVTADNVSYSTTINGTDITLNELLVFETQEVTIQSIEVSPGAVADKKVGDALGVTTNPHFILVTAENGSELSYSLYLAAEDSPMEIGLLFDQYNSTNCINYATINFGDLRMENNMWNSGNLTPGTFSQCIYHYDQAGTELFGWDWSFPTDATGVNAYPQIIYGWKPWHGTSTVSGFPKKIGDISSLKANYDAILEVERGGYNLAFDNWITYTEEVNSNNLEFEFMIWEDAQSLAAFGDYQENVVTTNGTYKFYTGDPSWGDWTYLAFVRTEKRQSGTVDIDELLDYLVDEGIVSPDSYMASIEFGNEVANSKGFCVMKSFEVVIQ